ncbi:hypothetical protein FOL47_007965 [Perkinsus chesapeaki]|uniref:Uncharacterized protein n=1 Tax=Perkinsus chesapeaki TaxID=330153 RepID=A0A7J6LGQ4_PERCH|nr:hypothetical protein FOL47_007965 [Perkinsus chesapeaki]
MQQPAISESPRGSPTNSPSARAAPPAAASSPTALTPEQEAKVQEAVMGQLKNYGEGMVSKEHRATLAEYAACVLQTQATVADMIREMEQFLQKDAEDFVDWLIKFCDAHDLARPEKKAKKAVAPPRGGGLFSKALRAATGQPPASSSSGATANGTSPSGGVGVAPGGSGKKRGAEEGTDGPTGGNKIARREMRAIVKQADEVRLAPPEDSSRHHVRLVGRKELNQRAVAVTAQTAARNISELPPVGNETLAGIPVASHTTLSFMMYRCSRYGPHDDVTWRKLLGRGAIVCSRMVPRDVALVINALQRRMSEGRDAEGQCLLFVRKLISRHLEGGPMKCEDYNAQNIALIVHGVTKFGVELSQCPVISGRLRQLLPEINAQQLVMVGPGVFGIDATNEEMQAMQLAALERCADIASSLTSQGVSILFNSLAKDVPLATPQAWAAVVQLCTRLTDSDVIGTTTPQGTALVRLMQNVNEELSRSGPGAETAVRAIGDMLEMILAGLTECGGQLNTYITRHAAFKLVSLLLSSVSRLPDHIMSRHRQKLLDDTLLPALQRNAMHLATGRRYRNPDQTDGEMHSLVACGHAMASLGIRDAEIFAAFGESVLIRLIHAERHRGTAAAITSREASMILYSWAKAHMHADDLIQHILPLVSRAASEGCLTLHEASLAVFGAGHFRVGDDQWWLTVTRLFRGSQDRCECRQSVILANAVARVIGALSSDTTAEIDEVVCAAEI